MLLALGQFVFALDTLAYQSLQRSSAWRHAKNSRMGARPADQFVGPGDDTLQLSGVLLPQFKGDTHALDTLRAMAATGDAYPLVDGRGSVLGAWVIDSINETQSVFLVNGAPRKIEFQLALHHVDDSAVSAHSAGQSPANPADAPVIVIH